MKKNLTRTPFYAIFILFFCSKTFHLGERTNFNGQLKNLNRKFTYFVPRDYAWQKAEIMFPSAHKKLFMPEFGYHVIIRHIYLIIKRFRFLFINYLFI